MSRGVGPSVFLVPLELVCGLDFYIKAAWVKQVVLESVCGADFSTNRYKARFGSPGGGGAVNWVHPQNAPGSSRTSSEVFMRRRRSTLHFALVSFADPHV